MEITFCEIEEKTTEFNNTIIDSFEDFINFVQQKISHYSCIFSGVYVKSNIVERFENALQRIKILLLEVNFYTRNQFSKKKVFVIERFEYFLRSLQDMVDNIDIKVKKQVTSLRIIKGDFIDGFENLRQALNDDVMSKKDSVKRFVVNKKTVIVSDFDDLVDNLKLDVNHAQQIMNRKKNEIVDEFEEAIENTKWMIADRQSAFIHGAERVFEDIREQLENIIEEGKNEMEQEVDSINYALKMGESVLTDFVQYCECTASEFFQFSDTRAVTLLQEGKKMLKMFYNEVVDSLVRGYEDKLLCDNLVLEINSSRYAYNVTMSEVNFHVVRALLTLPQPDGNTWPQLVARLVYFTPILTNYIRSPTAQQDCLLAIEDVAGSHQEVFDCLVKLIHWLYEQDILSEEAILQWYSHPDPESDSISSAKIRKQVSPFIKWLKEAEEQSSEEEETDSSVD